MSDLIDAKALFAALAEAADGTLVFITEPTGRMLWCNDQFVERTGYTVDDFQFDNPDNPFLHPDDADRVTAWLAAFAGSDEARSEAIENRFINRWGETVDVRSVVAKARWAGTDAFMVTATLRTPSDEARRASEERYRSVVESAAEGIVKLASDGRVHFSNRQFRELVARDAVALGSVSFWTLLHHDDEPLLRAALVPDDHVVRRPTDVRLVAQDGQLRWVSVSARRLIEGADAGLWLLVLRDVTERRLLERQVEHAQKLETLGVFAGGIAHDFNNIITGVLGNIDFVLAHPGLDPALREALSDARVSAQRAGTLSHSMLAYAGKSVVKRAELSLVEVLSEMSPLLRSVVDRRVTLDVTMGEEPLNVRMDPVQLQQVVMNLVTNAAEASGDGDRRVDIEIGRLTTHARDAGWLPDGLPAGTFACISVRDRGDGMDAHARDRMFDPFFTTKTDGRGLGLSAVLGIARAHEGALRVRSTPGEGTEIDVALPLSSGLSAPRPTLAAEGERRDARSGTVLYVDDEELLRRIGYRILTGAGYEAVVAESGARAVELVRAQPERFSALLVDFRMPRMAGDEVIRALADVAPALPVACLSGDAGSALNELTTADGKPVRTLDKPFGRAELIGLVDELVGYRAG